jgi:hypothetical protein
MEDKLLAAIIGAIAGVVTTYLGAILKFRVDLKSQYDKDLRDKRLAQYSELWKLTGIFPKYAREKQLSHQDLQGLKVTLREWYFTKGGMFLSDTARDAYFALQEELKSVSDNLNTSQSVVLDEVAYERLRSQRQCSTFCFSPRCWYTQSLRIELNRTSSLNAVPHDCG